MKLEFKQGENVVFTADDADILAGTRNTVILKEALLAEDNGRLLDFSYDQLRVMHNAGGSFLMDDPSKIDVGRMFKQIACK